MRAVLARTPHITRRVHVPRRPGPSLTGYTATTKMTGILPVVEDLGFGVFVAARVAPLLARMNGRSRSQLPPASDITDHTARALITSTNKRRRHDARPWFEPDLKPLPFISSLSCRTLKTGKIRKIGCSPKFNRNEPKQCRRPFSL